MTDTADIIVIGGGMAGISAAALLSAEAKVTVLEAEANLAYHATGRSAAIFIRNYGNATLRALNAAAEPVLSGQGEFEPVMSPRGELIVAREDEMDELEQYLQGSDGVEKITPAEAKSLLPVLRADKLMAAAYEQSAQDIDVDRLLQGYVQKLRENGGTIVTDARVSALTHSGPVWTVSTAKQSWSAPVIINAAGAWADQIATLAGLPGLGLAACRRSAALIDAGEWASSVHNWPLCASASEDWYMKPEAGKLMVSPADEDPLEPQDAWADDMVIAEGLYRFEQMIDLPITRPSHVWAGLRSFFPDRTPVVGFDPRSDGFFWLAGQGGYGIQTAPALAAITRDLCTGSTPKLPAEVIAALHPDRLVNQ